MVIENCLHADELDFLQELVGFLTHFKRFMDLFGSSQPTLSIVSMMKMKIKKLCIASPTDDPKIKAIKSAVLAKVDHRFPESEQIKLHQLLDPQTKTLIPRTDATIILENAIKDAVERNFITVPETMRQTREANTHNSKNEGPEEKKRRLRLELLNEFCSEMSQSTHQGNDLNSLVSIEILLIVFEQDYEKYYI